MANQPTFKISRTYPQPDSPAENLGPRERAMAVFKYVLGIMPEQAAGSRKRGIDPHPAFELLVHAFEQQRRLALVQLARRPVLYRLRQAFLLALGRPLASMEQSMVEEQQSTYDVPVQLMRPPMPALPGMGFGGGEDD